MVPDTEPSKSGYPVSQRDFQKKMVALIQEYIEEVEHIEGKEYWEQFRDMQDAVLDFALYLMMLEKEQ